MYTPFFYEALPMRVSFGAGDRSKLADEVNKLGLKRVLVLSHRLPEGPRPRDLRLTGRAQRRRLRQGRNARPHRNRTGRPALATEAGADGCIAVGGGSTTGLGKAIALEYGTPIIALPTTYAGSEMTPVWGLTADGVKKTGQDPRVLPTSVIYDPELTLSLPVGMSVTSGFNAIAHAVEALYAPDGSPIISLMAEEGVRALVTALPNIVKPPQNIEHRSEALYGAWLCGRPWAPQPCPCTTSSATRSAGPSISRTPQPTPSFSRTPWHTTPPRCPAPLKRSGGPPEPQTRPPTCANSASSSAPPPRCANSG